MNEWRTKYRRKMNDADNEKNTASVDSILNFETVSPRPVMFSPVENDPFRILGT